MGVQTHSAEVGREWLNHAALRAGESVVHLLRYETHASVRPSQAKNADHLLAQREVVGKVLDLRSFSGLWSRCGQSLGLELVAGRGNAERQT
jgi:hypothetical protein